MSVETGDRQMNRRTAVTKTVLCTRLALVAKISEIEGSKYGFFLCIISSCSCKQDGLLVYKISCNKTNKKSY